MPLPMYLSEDTDLNELIETLKELRGEIGGEVKVRLATEGGMPMAHVLTGAGVVRTASDGTYLPEGEVEHPEDPEPGAGSGELWLTVTQQHLHPYLVPEQAK